MADRLPPARCGMVSGPTPLSSTAKRNLRKDCTKKPQKTGPTPVSSSCDRKLRKDDMKEARKTGAGERKETLCSI